jgi:hypothetical protein
VWCDGQGGDEEGVWFGVKGKRKRVIFKLNFARSGGREESLGLR